MRHAGKKEQGQVRIGSLFDVYKKRLRAPQGSVIETAREVIAEVTGIALPKEVFEYTPHTKLLRINARGAQKSEVFLHKEEILAHLKGRLGIPSAPTTIL